MSVDLSQGVAIVGMACRFPGATTCEELWQNLIGGVESITFASKEELLAAAVEADLVDDPAFVPGSPLLGDITGFDADLFGFSPREAETLDPQQRLLLECAWESLERAGYDPDRYSGSVAVFGGVGVNLYAAQNLHHLYAGGRGFEVMLSNDKDFAASRVAYKLNLRGPAVTVQTACSTSLVAVHMACQSLLAGESDLALAGGASLRLPHRPGYLFQEGMIASPDGHCRAFDAKAAGTAPGSGAGMVALKRMEDVDADRDQVLAVILGSAVNNDGSHKAGYTAPSAAGQAAVIREALAVAGVDAADVGYVEAHGTGTPLGDPLEVQALADVFPATGRCALGSVKTNIGHVDTAAGAAGLIKAALATATGTIPASLHFTEPNPHIPFAAGPFRVQAETGDWPNTAPLRIAGVSSFGIGGTNAHVVVAAPPSQQPHQVADDLTVLTLSAQTATALEASSRRLADHLEQAATPLADAAFTLALGRKQLPWRRTVAAASRAEAVAALRGSHAGGREERPGARPVALLFSGQGAQHPGMARDLYDAEPLFRETFDELAEVARPWIDLHADVLRSDDADRLRQTAYAQPALFAVEYATAQLLLSWGVRPSVLLGHSVGELAGAAVAGVFSPPDAMRLVCRRGELMQSMPPGAMLAVPLGADALELPSDLALAALNAPAQSVVSGPTDRVGAYAQELSERGVQAVRLHTSHGFHSAMMDPILDDFRRAVESVQRRAPSIPLLSNVTGAPLTSEQATSPDYWAKHLRETVRFNDAIGAVLAEPRRLVVEVGPGRTLERLAASHPAQQDEQAFFSTLPGARDTSSARKQLFEAVAGLWRHGVPIDWQAFHAERPGRRATLPTYPFERRRYWIDAPSVSPSTDRRRDVADWFHVPGWRPAPRTAASSDPRRTVILSNDDAPAHRLAAALRSATVARLDDLAAVDDADSVVLLAPADPTLDTAFHAALAVVQRLAAEPRPDRQATVVTRTAYALTGADSPTPLAVTAVGPFLAARQEIPGLRCRHIDVDTDFDTTALAAELAAEDLTVALRRSRRWTPVFRRLQTQEAMPAVLREGGVYLITGGLGGIGLTLAESLARQTRAKVVLLSRSPDEARTARAMQAIAAAGGEALVLAADVADANSLQAAVTAARVRFGQIHGVIHAAGVAGGGLLALRTREEADRVLLPKVQGTLHLAAACPPADLDFFALCGSLTAVAGGFGQADYIAANAFLDAFAEHAHTNGWPVISLAWDTWRDVGMAADADAPPELKRLWADSLEQGIRPTEGAQAFLRALTLGIPRTLVSPTDVERKIDQAREALPASLDQLAADRAARDRHPRPQLSTEYQTPKSAMEERLCSLWGRNLGFEGIGAEDDYFELGGDSLTAVSVANEVQQWLGETVHVTAVFEAPTPRKLAAYLDRHYTQAAEAEQPLTATDLETLCAMLPHLPPRAARPTTKNPRAVFLLAAPRTGSTLLRAMLAGHPRLFAPPELALLSSNTLAERRDLIPGADAGLLDGPVHALKQALGVTADEADARLRALESSGTTVAAFYALLQDALGDRLLIDKTPHYALDQATLERAEEDFEQPLYVLLTRRPEAMIRSYVEAKLDLLLPRDLREQGGFSRRRLAELVWLHAYQNLLALADRTSAGRCIWLRFEDLVAAPEREADRLCNFLGVDLHPAMLDPYADTGRRMTDGLRPDSRMLGDVKFHQHQAIDPAVADRWRDDSDPVPLSPITQEVAATLGYADESRDEYETSVSAMSDDEVDAELEAELARLARGAS